MTIWRRNFLALLLTTTGLLFFAMAPAICSAAETDDELGVSEIGDAVALTQIDMADGRGAQGGNTLTTTQSLAATTSGNTMTVTGNMTNGAISVGDQFGGSGFGSYVMNTGNNSTLTAATAVTVQMAPSP